MSILDYQWDYAISQIFFQEKMSEWMAGLEFARAYIDDLLVTSKSFNEHLEHLELIFTHLQEAGLKVNATKSLFCAIELEYLGYTINRKGTWLMTKKVEAIQKLGSPKNRRQLRRFLGMINYYQNMWPNEQKF